MTYLVYVHGLDNKPAAEYLLDVWDRKLAHDAGIATSTEGIGTAMCYWADVLYPAPDENLAAYESAAGAIELIDSPATDAAAWRATDGDPLEREKVRRLAERLGVDPEAADDLAPSAQALADARFERVPVPEWLRLRIMRRLVRDAHHYFLNVEFSPRPGAVYKVRDELRRRFIASLHAARAAATEPIVVLAHSLGSVIAYDCLKHEDDCPAIDGLVTIGSPLGLDEVQDFFPSWSPNDGFPSEKLRGRWVNVYDPEDVVAAPDPRLGLDYRRKGAVAVEDVLERNWGMWRHSSSKYLQGPLLRSHLARMLNVPQVESDA